MSAEAGDIDAGHCRVFPDDPVVNRAGGEAAVWQEFCVNSNNLSHFPVA